MANRQGMAAPGVKSEEALVPRQSAAGEINLVMELQGLSRQELAASDVNSEGTHVPRQSAAGEINLATELQGPVGEGWRFPASRAKRLLVPDKVRLVK